jgi:hypothetical protein
MRQARLTYRGDGPHGFGRRQPVTADGSLVETAIGRYKHLMAAKLRTVSLAAQQGEVEIAMNALSRMIRMAKPLSALVT